MTEETIETETEETVEHIAEKAGAECFVHSPGWAETFGHVGGMATVECYGCGRQVVEGVRVCPNCGACVRCG